MLLFAKAKSTDSVVGGLGRAELSGSSRPRHVARALARSRSSATSAGVPPPLLPGVRPAPGTSPKLLVLSGRGCDVLPTVPSRGGTGGSGGQASPNGANAGEARASPIIGLVATARTRGRATSHWPR